jgi:hypothetical protein
LWFGGGFPDEEEDEEEEDDEKEKVFLKFTYFIKELLLLRIKNNGLSMAHEISKTSIPEK